MNKDQFPVGTKVRCKHPLHPDPCPEQGTVTAWIENGPSWASQWDVMVDNSWSMPPHFLEKMEEIMEDYREFELVTLAGQFTVLVDMDDDELHTLLYNEDGLAMFTVYDGKPLLVRGDSILALWEI
jgi:hypothetical protein